MKIESKSSLYSTITFRGSGHSWLSDRSRDCLGLLSHFEACAVMKAKLADKAELMVMTVYLNMGIPGSFTHEANLS